MEKYNGKSAVPSLSTGWETRHGGIVDGSVSQARTCIEEKSHVDSRTTSVISTHPAEPDRLAVDLSLSIRIFLGCLCCRLCASWNRMYTGRWNAYL